MRSPVVTLTLMLSLTLAGCGDDGGAPSAPPSTEPPTEVAVDGCEQRGADAAEAQATDSFPDNPHNTWVVAGTSTDEAGRSVVEVVPIPPDVGYPRFRFVSRCEDDEVVLLGAYALDDGAWVLLFTTDDADVGDLEMHLDS